MCFHKVLRCIRTICLRMCEIITASSTVGLNILLKYTERFRPFHLVLIRVKSE